MALPTQCRLCHAEHDKQVVVTPHAYGAAGSQAFFHCLQCDVIYSYPGLSPEEEARFYAAEFESFMASRSGKAGGWERADGHVSANEVTRVRRMKYIEKYLSKAGKILEIGCSSGFMLYPLVQSGYECVGVEPSGVFRDFVESRGITCYKSIEEAQGARYDAILHFFVLEHIADPRSFLQGQLDLLNPGGVIIFEIPNAADPLYSIYDIPAFERFYWSIAHHWYFSHDSLIYLMREIGCVYQILLDQRYDLSNHMVWARDGRPGGMGRFTPMLGEKIEEAYKQALIRSGHCDTLVAILRKTEEQQK